MLRGVACLPIHTEHQSFSIRNKARIDDQSQDHRREFDSLQSHQWVFEDDSHQKNPGDFPPKDGGTKWPLVISCLQLGQINLCLNV
jgi:hypothetical protein